MFSETWSRAQAEQVEGLIYAILANNGDIIDMQSASSKRNKNYQVYFRHINHPERLFYIQYFIKENALRFWSARDNNPVPTEIVDFFDLSFKKGIYSTINHDGKEYHYLKGISEQYLREVAA